LQELRVARSGRGATSTCVPLLQLDGIYVPFLWASLLHRAPLLPPCIPNSQ
jgi:hypothetical protein